MMEYRKHSTCSNYENGYCKLFNIKVDPEAPACPRYTPKAESSSLNVPSYEPVNSPQPIYYGFMSIRRRQHRNFGRSRGFGRGRQNGRGWRS